MVTLCHGGGRARVMVSLKKEKPRLLVTRLRFRGRTWGKSEAVSVDPVALNSKRLFSRNASVRTCPEARTAIK